MATKRFNIDNSVNVSAEIARGNEVVSLFDDNGNSLVERLGVERYRNVRGAIATLLQNAMYVSVRTNCGVEVFNGYRA